MKNVSKCNIRTNRLLRYKQYLKCSLCNNHSHNKCNKLTKSEGDNILSHASSQANWICYVCSVNSNCNTNVTEIRNEGGKEPTNGRRPGN